MPTSNDQPAARRPNTFMTSFVPGMVLGLVIGLFAGVFAVPLLLARLEGGSGTVPNASQRRAMPSETGDRGEAPKDGPANEQRPSDTPAADPAMNGEPVPGTPVTPSPDGAPKPVPAVP
ncbi:MAG: hypothetical protein K2X32_12510 [Phycisphaerales bacterium]|nr:hypothetical protein [Phycisphaerales bacterium]